MKIESSACPHDSSNFQQGVGELSESNNRQLAEDFDMLFLIPWRYHRYIIDKVKGYCQKTLFFVRKTLENWGRGMLMNSLTTDLYERQGAAQTNFVISRDRFFFHARNQKTVSPISVYLQPFWEHSLLIHCFYEDHYK